jgi:hypothetical protein
MSRRSPEAVDSVAVGGLNTTSARYHGAPDVEGALGYSNSTNMYGERVLFVGDLSDRWNITSAMSGQGAEVTVVDTYTEGNPMTRVKKNSKVLEGKKYDRAVVAMTSAFREPKARVGLFKDIARKVDFKNGGRLGVTALDFTDFETDSAASDNETVKAIADLNKRFFETVGFDRNSGATLENEVGQAVKGNKNLKVEVEINQRPKGREHWAEVQDLLAFQVDIIDNAVKSLPPDFIASLIPHPAGKLLTFKRNLLVLKAQIVALQPSVAEIVALPVEERPETLPPRVFTAVVTEKE